MLKFKAPRIFHLPWSQVVSKDDKFIKSTTVFRDKEVVVSLKLDGENISLYNDGSFHAKSLDSKQHDSRDWLYSWWANRLYTDTYVMVIHNKWPELRLVGKNMFASHTIKYNNLEDLFILHSAWNGTTCLSWKDTLDISYALNIQTAPVLFKGVYDELTIRKLDSLEKYRDDLVEGYVVRNSDVYSYKDSLNNIAKFVSNRFNITSGDDWMHCSITKNKVNEI